MSGDIGTYLGLFGAAFLAATLIPAQSESLLAYLLLTGERSVIMLLATASIGNVLGSVLNWWLGRHVARFRDRRWFPAGPAALARAEGWYRRYGRWSLLASWVPVVGDPLTVVAGVLREPLGTFLLLVTIAKAGRYLALAGATLGLM